MRPLGRSGRRALKWTIRTAALLLGLYVIVDIIPRLLFPVYVAWILYERNFDQFSKTNSRGDKVTVTMDEMREPDEMIVQVTLRRSYHWFSTTLLEVSRGYRFIDPKWPDDNTLVLEVDVDPDAQIGPRVEQVGPIQIFYHFFTPPLFGRGPEFDPDKRPRPATGQ